MEVFDGPTKLVQRRHSVATPMRQNFHKANYPGQPIKSRQDDQNNHTLQVMPLSYTIKTHPSFTTLANPGHFTTHSKRAFNEK